MRGKYVVNPKFMRAISSPSLSEQPIEDCISSNIHPTNDSKTPGYTSNSNSSSTASNLATSAAATTTNRRAIVANAVPGSVLQKLKNTFSQLKGAGKSTVQSNNSNANTSATIPFDASAATSTSISVASSCTNSSSINSHNQQQSSHSANNNHQHHNHHFSASTTNQPHNHNDTTTTYRFGPLVWRTSKERRKTKTHRRDKCNSGDSGIQVELDGNDDAIIQQASSAASDIGHETITPATGNNDTTPTITEASATENDAALSNNSTTTTTVRRANSAKEATTVATSSAAILAKFQRQRVTGSRSERFVRAMPVRSHSQPNGLDRLMYRSAHLECGARTASTITGGSGSGANSDSNSDEDDDDDDDSCSASQQYMQLHHHPHAKTESVFAEVLYPFRPASEQELALKQGALVEVMHREPGPWWWGRIRMDAVLEEAETPRRSSSCNDDADEDVTSTGREGWFPKDFVRLIVVPLYTTTSLGGIVNGARQKRGLVTRTMAPVAAPFAEAINCDIRLENDRQLMVEGSAQMMTSLTTATAAVAAAAVLTPSAVTAATLTVTTTPVTSFKRAASESPPNVSPRPLSMPNSDVIRLNVIKELINTEENYVKLLAALCQGYLHEMRQRPDIFTADSVQVIFSNVEQLWHFQQKFLDALRLGVAENRIADTFIQYQSGFMVYSVYCNSYTRALVELDTYTSNAQAASLLESCRLAQNLPELPLSAHLLAPVQRICRYPLHLGELVKHTTAANNSEAECDTKAALENSLAAMKRVTEMVNEGKRHSEYLGRVQARFDNFQGPALGVHSTRLFLQTDAIRMTPNLWNNTYTLFLFDKQLVYCKKDLLKRTTYTYKGRIFIDTCRIVNLPDGKIFGLTLKNALRIYCDLRGKWFDFCFRSASSKLRFLSTLAAERKFSGRELFVMTEFDGAGGSNEAASSSNSSIIGNSGGGSQCGLSNSSSAADADDDAVADDMTGIMMLPLKHLSHRYDANEYGDPNASEDAERTTTTTMVDLENVMNAANTELPSASSLSNVRRASDVASSHQKDSVQPIQRSCDTLPKKSRKLNRDAVPPPSISTSSIATNSSNVYAEYSSSSLGRKRIGNWFRKAKSTNSTPSHSPTHHQHHHQSTQNSNATTTTPNAGGISNVVVAKPGSSLRVTD